MLVQINDYDKLYENLKEQSELINASIYRCINRTFSKSVCLHYAMDFIKVCLQKDNNFQLNRLSPSILNHIYSVNRKDFLELYYNRYGDNFKERYKVITKINSPNSDLIYKDEKNPEMLGMCSGLSKFLTNTAINVSFIFNFSKAEVYSELDRHFFYVPEMYSYNYLNKDYFIRRNYSNRIYDAYLYVLEYLLKNRKPKYNELKKLYLGGILDPEVKSKFDKAYITRIERLIVKYSDQKDLVKLKINTI